MSQTQPSPDPSLIQQQALAVSLAATQEKVGGLTEDMHDLGRKVGGLETEMRRGFSGVTDQVSKIAYDFQQRAAALSTEAARAAAPKGVQWPMVAVFCSVAFAMAAWASSYFGKDIQALSRENTQSAERLSILSNRLHDESVKGAKSVGAQERDAYWLAKDHERMQAEIDRLRAAAKAIQ